MLRSETNELLRGPDPVRRWGTCSRQYWIPVLLTEELPEDDCPPVRVKILSERLIAFRDGAGRHGLRCTYHGWKYDATGRCEQKEAAARTRYRAGELSLDVNDMRGRLARKGLTYVDEDLDE